MVNKKYFKKTGLELLDKNKVYIPVGNDNNTCILVSGNEYRFLSDNALHNTHSFESSDGDNKISVRDLNSMLYNDNLNTGNVYSLQDVCSYLESFLPLNTLGNYNNVACKSYDSLTMHISYNMGDILRLSKINKGIKGIVNSKSVEDKLNSSKKGVNISLDFLKDFFKNTILNKSTFEIVDGTPYSNVVVADFYYVGGILHVDRKPNNDLINGLYGKGD